MTLRRFIDVAFAILVDELSRHGKSLFEAIDAVSVLGTDAGPVVPSPVDNKASMDALMSVMSGVRGAPV